MLEAYSYPPSAAVASSVGPPATAGAEAGAEAEPELELEAGVEAEAEAEPEDEPEDEPEAEAEPEDEPELAELDELSKSRTLAPSSLPQLTATRLNTATIGINKSAIFDLTTSPLIFKRLKMLGVPNRNSMRTNSPFFNLK